MPTALCGFNDSTGVNGCDLLAATGPTLLVRIGFDATFDPVIIPARLPNLPQGPLHALVDTGASESCIDSTLAMNLNLPIVDRRMISGAHGRGEVNVHLAQIHIPSLAFTLYGPFAAVDLVAGGQPHFALIGGTFLWHFTMVYEGRTGTVKLSNDT
jgi:gag-polyprotein putative aspartyl protease